MKTVGQGVQKLESEQTDKQKDTHDTHRQKDRHTERHRNRHSDRHTHRHTDTQTVATENSTYPLSWMVKRKFKPYS